MMAGAAVSGSSNRLVFNNRDGHGHGCTDSSSRRLISRKQIGFGFGFGKTSVGRGRISRRRNANAVAVVAESSLEYDVVVVGAGIIGLSIARHLLLASSHLSVAVVDASVPCASGATGAGQGYIWLAHKTPGSDIWQLGTRSKRLWDALATNIKNQGRDPLEVLGWKRTGSLLVGETSEELMMLKNRVKLLSEAGVRAEYMSGSTLLCKEPELEVGKERGAVFVPDDCQLDALRTVAFIEEANRYFISRGRYAEFYNDPAICLLRSGISGEVKAVQTSRNTLHCKKAVVIAAGSWSGSLTTKLIAESNIVLNVPVTPRKGHLLVIENFNSILLNHGLMEVGYVDHQIVSSQSTASASATINDEQKTSISMTATMDAAGNLVLGSSRQFAGFNTQVDDLIIQGIWSRAAKFFPKLRELDISDLSKNRKVRVGLRPYMPDGKPIIGPVPGLPKVLLATGHEGNGLSLALGTAEMVADMVLGNPAKVDCTPFSILGRHFS